MTARLKVLVVEDSPTARALIVEILSADDGFGDVRTANSGEDALRILAIWQPDVVTMDIHLSGLDGFDTTEQIMRMRPVPVVVVSSQWNPHDDTTTFRTLEAGALTALPKPPSPNAPEFPQVANRLVETLKSMARVRPMQRYAPQRHGLDVGRPSAAGSSSLLDDSVALTRRTPAFLAIGGSTGAPPVIKQLLLDLPRPFPAPVLIVQHMSPGFIEGMSRWLSDSTGLDVRVLSRAERPRAGRVYLAPDHHHLGLTLDGRLMLSDAPPEHSMRPAISHLFRSLAVSCPGQVLPILLTGMGRDGAAELLDLRNSGCETVAQDETSCVVYGMPARAVELGAATRVLSPAGMSQLIARRFARGR